MGRTYCACKSHELARELKISSCGDHLFITIDCFNIDIFWIICNFCVIQYLTKNRTGWNVKFESASIWVDFG